MASTQDADEMVELLGYELPGDEDEPAPVDWEAARDEAEGAVFGSVVGALEPGDTVADEVAPARELGMAAVKPQSTWVKTAAARRKQYPFRCVGWVAAQFPRGQLYGTAALVGPRHLLTAYHNVYNHDQGGETTGFLFIPARDGKEEPRGKFAGRKLFRPSGYQPGKPAYDWALVQLNRSPQLGHIGLCYLGDPRSVLKRTLTVAGYPHRTDDRHCPPELPDEYGTVMWEDSGLATGMSDDGKVLTHHLDIWVGHSGSPLWLMEKGKPYIIGVQATHSPITARPRDNQAAMIDKPCYEAIRNWIKQYP